MQPSPSDTSSDSAQPSDPWHARLFFRVLPPRAAPWFITLWLVILVSGLVAAVAVGGPWVVPGVLTAMAALTGTGAGLVVLRRRASGSGTPPPADDE